MLLRYGAAIGLSASKIKLGQYLFLCHGGKVAFFGRLVAVLRMLAALLAGVNRMDWGRFLLANAAGSMLWAECLGIEVRLLPRATPELNAMDTLWKQVKRDALGDRPTASIDQSAEGACEHILAMRPHDRLRQAGVLSGNFWLTK